MNLTFNGVSKSYNGNKALNNFTTQLTAGVYGLLGANGAGKTTLINVLTGLIKKDCGDIFYNDKNICSLGKHFLSDIGYLPQYPTFYNEFSVSDFLSYMCALKGLNKYDGFKRSCELLTLVNMEKAMDKKICTLSGGMKQRIGIVQAMLANPRVLILDEPTAGLDPSERIRFRNLIAKLSDDRIVIFATHIVSDIELVANEIIIMKNGKLIKQSSCNSLCEELNNKVWLVKASSLDDIGKYEKHLVSNINTCNSEVSIKIISDNAPSSSAVSCTASLEDVFLYYNNLNNI